MTEHPTLETVRLIFLATSPRNVNFAGGDVKVATKVSAILREAGIAALLVTFDLTRMPD